jgi:DNA-binding MarR family transcriptional regulator
MHSLMSHRTCGPPAEDENDWNAKSQSLDESLSAVMDLIKPIISSTLHDAALAHVMLENDLFVEPLTWHEFTVLACALYQEKRTIGEGFDYGSVVELTDRFRGKPMNTTMIYKTVVALQERGLVASIGKERSARGRVADHFVVTANGRAAFRLATSNALFLKSSRDSVAA